VLKITKWTISLVDLYLMGLSHYMIEDAGIAKVMISLIPGIAEKLNIPRTLMVPFKLGRTCGEQFDFETREKGVCQMLELSKKHAGTIKSYG
jgi:hypothetical protein